MVIKIDKKACIGCGACSAACDKVFELKEEKGEMKAFVKAQKSLPCVQEAIDSCPVNAISK